MNYLKVLVEDIHSVTIATVDEMGRPVTRVIDMMLYDDAGVYFLTAKGKAFYEQLMEQKYVSLSAVQGKMSIALHGNIRCIGQEKLDAIFEKNVYMQSIYPQGKREPLQVFQLYEATGQYFDISDPSHIVHEDIQIGQSKQDVHGYFVNDNCVGCHACVSVCPQNCIQRKGNQVEIIQSHCLRCGACMQACPHAAIDHR